MVHVAGPRWVARLPAALTGKHGPLCPPGDDARPIHSVLLVASSAASFYVLDPFPELKASLQQRAASHLIKIRLRRGDLLIIDNGRILHGRGELRSDSKRELLRAWIRRRA